MSSPSASPRRALIVIDAQNEYAPQGGLPIEWPPFEVSLANIGRAMDAAAAAGVPVVVVQNSAPAGAAIFAPGTAGWQLHPSVAARPRELLLEKRLPDAFAETGLGAWLTARGIDTLAIAGYMTHNCVDATVKHALHAGYRLEVLEDATGSVPYANRAGHLAAEAIHRAFMVVMQSRFAAVMPTGEWLEVLAGRRQAERDSIVASHRRARGYSSTLTMALPIPTSAAPEMSPAQSDS